MAQPKQMKDSAVASEHAEALPEDSIRLGSEANPLLRGALAVGLLGVVLAVVLGGGPFARQFQHSYLTAFMWGLSIGVGALWWVTLQHLVAARWSVAVRRVGELLAQSLVLMAVLALPVVVPMLLGNDGLYRWVNHEYMDSEHALHGKTGYLNIGFFLVRCAVYFGFWIAMARYFLKSSVAQDKSGDAGITRKMGRVSPVTMIVFALTITFCAVDFLMSLDPIWFSTIFGVYYFAGSVLAFHSTLALALIWLQKKRHLVRSVTVEHYHDIGKMMFGFTAFWTYIAFSQFMLIWYANIPEETHWYHMRLEGGWWTATLLLAILHFPVPFFGLMSRHVKRNRFTLGIGAVYLLIIHWYDMYWLVAPNLHDAPVLHAADFAAWAGIAGLIVAFVVWKARSVNLLATKDPRLARSLAFENI
jgi:hypothetical protein